MKMNSTKKKAIHSISFHLITKPELPPQEESSFLLHAKAEKIESVANGYFIVHLATGSSIRPIMKGIQIFHVDQEEPIATIEDENAIAACISYTQDHKPLLVFATKSCVYFYSFSDFNRPQEKYEYDGICGVITLPNRNIAIYGTETPDGHQWIAKEYDIYSNRAIHSWMYDIAIRLRPRNTFTSEQYWGFTIGNIVFHFPYDRHKSVSRTNLLYGTPRGTIPIFDQQMNHVGVVAWKGGKNQSSSERIDCHPPIPLTNIGVPKPVAHFLYQDEVITIQYDGIIQLLASNTSWSLPDAIKAAGIDIYPEHVLEWLDLRGALLINEELIIFGKNSFLISITLGQSPNLWRLNTWPQLHYGKGRVNQAIPLKGNNPDFPGPHFMTLSDDNDLRIWNLTNRECVGLFRGHANKLKLATQINQKLASVCVNRNLAKWSINKTATKRLMQDNPQQLAHVVFVEKYHSNAFVLNLQFQTSIWPNQGEDWDSVSATQPNVQKGHEIFGYPKRIISLENSMAMNISSRLHFIRYDTQEHINRTLLYSPSSQKEEKWNVIHLAKSGQHLLVLGVVKPPREQEETEPVYFAALLTQYGEVQKYKPLLSRCSCITSFDQESFLVCEEDEHQKIITRIFWNENTSSPILLASFLHNASITGIYLSPSKNTVLAWDNVPQRRTALFYFAQNQLFKLEDYRFTRSPRQIFEIEDSLIIKSASSSWTIKPQKKQFLFQRLKNTKAICENFSSIYKQLCNTQSKYASTSYPVFTTLEQDTLILYAKGKNEVLSITWPCDKNTYIGGIYDNGRILFCKNRIIGVLQLMYKDKPLSLARLCRM